jgi:hypothetical protein
MAIHRGTDFDGPPSEKMMEEMGALIGDMAAAGVLVSTGGLLPSSQGFTIAAADEETGEYEITDGPFAETKEVIGGFAIMEVESKEEVIAWSKRFLDVVGEGYSEVRLMFQPQDDQPDLVKGEFDQVQA